MIEKMDKYFKIFLQEIKNFITGVKNAIKKKIKICTCKDK